jgi:hypothetical protein
MAYIDIQPNNPNKKSVSLCPVYYPYFPLVGVITDHLIDASWYGDNTDQRGI